MRGKVIGNCKCCGKKGNIEARGLIQSCWMRHRNNGTLDRYPKRQRQPRRRVTTPPKPRHVDKMAEVGVPYHSLHRWTVAGFLISHNPTPGSGRPRSWAPEELAVAGVMVRLINGAKLSAPMAAWVARANSQTPGKPIALAKGITIVIDKEGQP